MEDEFGFRYGWIIVGILGIVVGVNVGDATKSLNLGCASALAATYVAALLWMIYERLCDLRKALGDIERGK